MNVITGDHPQATALWHMVVLGLGILGLTRFLFVAERDNARCDCFDSCMGYDSGSVITTLSSDFQRRIDQHHFGQCGRL